MAIYTESHILDIEFNRMIKSIDESYSFDIEVLEEGVDIKGLIDKAINKIKEIFKALLNKIEEFINSKSVKKTLENLPASIEDIDEEKKKKADEYLSNNPIITGIDTKLHNILYTKKFTYDEMIEYIKNNSNIRYIESLSSNDDLNIIKATTDRKYTRSSVKRNEERLIDNIKKSYNLDDKKKEYGIYNMAMNAKALSHIYTESFKNSMKVLNMIK